MYSSASRVGAEVDAVGKYAVRLEIMISELDTRRAASVDISIEYVSPITATPIWDPMLINNQESAMPTAHG